MILQPNDNLISNICKVYLKSVHGKAFPLLSETHTSLSKIRWSSNATTTKAGLRYKNSLRLVYRGLSEEIFTEMDQLLKGHYEVVVKTNYGDHYRLSGSKNPMISKNRFRTRESVITLQNEDFLPIEYISQDLANDYGFAYVLSFGLS